MWDNQGIGDNHNAAGLRLVLQADRRVHAATGARGQGAARHAGIFRHAAARPAPDGPERRRRHAEGRHLQPRLPAMRRMAGRPVGARGRAVDAGAGLPCCTSRRSSITSRRSSGWRRGAAARLLAVGNGAAQPSRRRLRVRQDAARLRLSMGAGAGTHHRAPGERRRPREETPAAPAGLPQFGGRGDRHHRDDQDARLATPSWWRRCSRTTRRRASIAGSWPARACRRWSPRSPTARTAA